MVFMMHANGKRYRYAGALGIAVLLVLMLGQLSQAQSFIGSAEIHAPAVITSNNTGVLTLIKLTVSSGNGSVSVNGPIEVGASTVESAQTAAKYASSYLGLNFYNYSFNYTILNSDSVNVSGPSAGAAMTILAVAALTGKTLPNDFTMTGTINSNGTIGLIGGVYDKASAAKSGGMKFILVPAVPRSSSEDMLYAITQDEFNLPLVQVNNISSALQFALYGKSVSGQGTVYTPFVNYYVSRLPAASVQCTAACDGNTFNGLVAFTFNFTRNEIGTISSNPGFANITAQLSDILNQSIAEAGKGYGYTAADQSFLDYITAYYFSHHTITKQGGMQVMQNVSMQCSALTPATLTLSNYQYVLGGELRQLWANYTITQDIGEYNATAIDTDGVLDSIYTAGESAGWCAAASYMYNASSEIGGTPAAASQSLKEVAANKISRAMAYGTNLYSVTAQEAYRLGNYPLAILDADYAFAFGNATSEYSLGTGALINMSISLAKNSTFGVWATQFANEAMFYTSEASLATNSTLAEGYAQQAYSTALLASVLSNDTKLINSSLVAQPQVQQVQNYEGDFATLFTSLAAIEKELFAIFVMLLAIVVVLIAIFIALIVLINRSRNSEARSEVMPKQERSTRRGRVSRAR